MFKVLCINDNFHPADRRTASYKDNNPYPAPKYLQEYTVVAEDVEDGEREYELSEFPPCDAGAFFWDADAFVKLEGPDEVAIAEDRIKVDAEELDAEWRRLITEMDKA